MPLPYLFYCLCLCVCVPEFPNGPSQVGTQQRLRGRLPLKTKQNRLTNYLRCTHTERPNSSSKRSDLRVLRVNTTTAASRTHTSHRQDKTHHFHNRTSQAPSFPSLSPRYLSPACALLYQSKNCAAPFLYPPAYHLGLPALSSPESRLDLATLLSSSSPSTLPSRNRLNRFRITSLLVANSPPNPAPSTRPEPCFCNPSFRPGPYRTQTSKHAHFSGVLSPNDGPLGTSLLVQNCPLIVPPSPVVHAAGRDDPNLADPPLPLGQTLHTPDTLLFFSLSFPPIYIILYCASRQFFLLVIVS